jgi:hypothetical protein
LNDEKNVDKIRFTVISFRNTVYQLQ